RMKLVPHIPSNQYKASSGVFLAGTKSASAPRVLN
ncbi:uncharacterized protein METZ01_LOCUS61639, partial [marine metagenome]